MNPQVMQRVAKDIMNPPKVMQQRAIRDQERQKQYIQAKKDWDEYQTHQVAFEDKLKKLGIPEGDKIPKSKLNSIKKDLMAKAKGDKKLNITNWQ